MTPDEKACLQDGNKARMYEERKAKEKEKENSKTMFTFKLLNLLKKCREKGKYNLCGKLIKKYNIDKRKLEEGYYD
jgi:hypothetical protein|tara:strand:+ start:1112 stop:1339 length:228 start_codon:yes stop_codon:yes gene_type:complete